MSSLKLVHPSVADAAASFSDANRFGFLDVSIRDLEAMDDEQLDALSFGVIGLNAEGETIIYNATESSYAGLARASVIGRPFFLATGVCMNNFLVAQRLEDEPELDATIDYVLTFRMRPTPVKLRMLRSAAARHRFILLRR